MQFLITQRELKSSLRVNWLGFLLLLFTAGSSFAANAELKNLIVRNSNDQLQIDLTIKGNFTEKMKAALSKGIPISLTISILFYKVRDNWFDEKMLSKSARHDIKYDVLKHEFRVRRSWENRNPLIIEDLKKAQNLFTTIEGMDVIPLKRLKKGKHYQLRVKSEVKESKVHFTRFPWEFETDWYTINFIY